MTQIVLSILNVSLKKIAYDLLVKMNSCQISQGGFLDFSKNNMLILHDFFHLIHLHVICCLTFLE